jgi:hypothetical protein
MYLQMSSLPVPLSPSIRIGILVSATLSKLLRTAAIALVLPKMIDSGGHRSSHEESFFPICDMALQ